MSMLIIGSIRVRALISTPVLTLTLVRILLLSVYHSHSYAYSVLLLFLSFSLSMSLPLPLSLFYESRGAVGARLFLLFLQSCC